MNERLSIALQGNKAPAQYAELGALIEGYGFGTISVYGDLMFQPPLPALLAIAAATSRVRLGPACLNPFTVHPVEIAGQIAMLDLASDGRAYLGLARGAWLDTLGLRKAPAVAALDETVAIVRQLLSGKQRAFEGDVFRLAAHHHLEYEVRRRAVSVLIGTWGAQMAHLAGSVADELKVGGSANPAMVGVMRERLARGAASAVRDTVPGVVLGAVTVVDHDREAARALARREVARYLPVVAPHDPTGVVEPEVLAQMALAVDSGNLAAAAGLVSDDLLDRFAFAGTPEDVARQARSVLEAGAARVEFGTPHGLSAREGLRLLGTEVLPAVG